MKRFFDFFNQTEIKNVKQDQMKCKLIVEQLNKLVDLNEKFQLFDLDNFETIYLNIITTILLLPDYVQYRYLLIELLTQNNINERGLLLHLLGVINQYEDSCDFDFNRNIYISQLATLPYQQHINWDNTKIELQTKHGKIKVYRYDKIVTNNKVYKIMTTNCLANYCHGTVELLKDYYPTSYITTSEMPALFSEYIYHSYFKTDDGVVDISNNMFFPNDDFDRLFQPKEILRVKSSEFEEQYKKLLIEQNVKEDENFAPVLVMALNNKTKN